MLQESRDLERDHPLVTEQNEAEILHVGGRPVPPPPPPPSPARLPQSLNPLKYRLEPPLIILKRQRDSPSRFSTYTSSRPQREPGARPTPQMRPAGAAHGSLVNMKFSPQHNIYHDSIVCCVRYNSDGQYLATGSKGAAHVFNAMTGQRFATFSKDSYAQDDDDTGVDGYVRAVCFSPDNNWLITGAEDCAVKMWDMRNGKIKRRLVGHRGTIYSVDASANNQFIISGAGDNKAKVWSMETGTLLTTLAGGFGRNNDVDGDDGITSVSVSPTCRHVAAGSLDSVIRVWDVESKRLVHQFEVHEDAVYSVTFSPDGRMLLSGSLDKTLTLWDLTASNRSMQCRLSLTGHRDAVLSVAFCPTDRWLFSGSRDRTMQIWDPRRTTLQLMTQGHKNSVMSIAHSPSRASLATGSGDFLSRTWLYSS